MSAQIPTDRSKFNFRGRRKALRPIAFPQTMPAMHRAAIPGHEKCPVRIAVAEPWHGGVLLLRKRIRLAAQLLGDFRRVRQTLPQNRIRAFGTVRKAQIIWRHQQRITCGGKLVIGELHIRNPQISADLGKFPRRMGELPAPVRPLNAGRLLDEMQLHGLSADTKNAWRQVQAERNWRS